MADESEYEGWVILELMGHRKMSGYVRTVSMGGASMLRIDVPEPTAKDDTGPFCATQFYNPSAVYCITPCRADEAIAYAARCRPQPVSRWELPAIEEPRPRPDPTDQNDY